VVTLQLICGGEPRNLRGMERGAPKVGDDPPLQLLAGLITGIRPMSCVSGKPYYAYTMRRPRAR